MEQKGYTFIAHNSKAYDSMFILQYCINNGLKPDIIPNGTKIMEMKIKKAGIRFIDSYNFISQPLRAFPKTFGLKETVKGYFPHKFSSIKNLNYKGPYPEIDYYEPNKMKADDKKDFLKWYNDNKLNEFDFQVEMKKYCRADVEVLRNSCLLFRKGVIDITKNDENVSVDPFTYTTIATCAMADYKNSNFPIDKIAIVESFKDTFSKQSIKWLEYIQKKENIVIQHALKGGEYRVNNQKGNKIPVDGYCKTNNTIYQFHGCFWHGCNKCFDPNTKNKSNGKSMKVLYETTLYWTNYLKEKGYNVIEMWSHDLTNEITEFKLDFPVLDKLNPRDAFYGGRTETINVYKKPKENEILRYYDICSLYPAVQLFDNYPIGHPIKILSPKTYNNSWFGFIKCKILAPKKLFHPVLPIKANGKLTFSLCYECSKNQINKCFHDEKSRSIIGTWTTIEIEKALEKGYKILEIYEVHHFEEKSNDLFKHYIEKHMKIKLESSVDNTSFKIDLEKQKYINEAKIMGINLDEKCFSKNPGKKAIAKIFLNSLWGKFGQRDNLKQVEFITEIADLYKIYYDKTVTISDLSFINQDVVRVEYKRKDIFIEDPKLTNIYIAAYTTANARLRLYEVLDKLDDKVIYMDTDSVIFADNGKIEIKTGNLVGDWEDEFKDLKNYDNNVHGITEFVSTGPKSYAYITNININGEIHSNCKFKGFRNSVANNAIINMENMKKLIQNQIDKLSVKEDIFVRDIDGEIRTKTQDKSYTFLENFDKRVLNDEQIQLFTSNALEIDSIESYPYGY